MAILQLHVGDRLLLKKAHPCGADIMEVLRVGSDVRLRCTGCARDLTLPRVKLEKSVRRVTATESDATKGASL